MNLTASLWKSPLEDTPDINKQDPDISYRQVSDKVLVKIKRHPLILNLTLLLQSILALITVTV